MAISKAEKKEFIIKFGGSEKNTGSIQAQVAILTQDIKNLTSHINDNKKDKHSKRGLIAKVNKRKNLLKYLYETDINKYRETIKTLGLRK